ncbi:tRNA (cytosine(34)-C(5))-methyltransferase isoform X2 [Eurytemora carolleeae]|uniref:tRNA (cytosine(34)-C(5))-methyltransferase isoform X2 n=1 Tax=Eurytemora carolleeae TaxID=1294199 RepID=UPI000C791E8C|nr:tRNA (cytosine(34)-C(5))-methyltransferase isoform X2 [Eurytemora carolleeae]|eukprot:XP_023334254.1 tRNA (cytosine(34)-C(5))-methyltransferase-like isoform X2 [Eurytemora affinis]
MYLSIKNGIVGFLRVLTNPKRAYSIPALQSCRNSKGILVKTNKQNKLFEEFYKKQKICEDHEFNTFLDVCRSGLPAAFRVILSKPEATRILTKLSWS